MWPFNRYRPDPVPEPIPLTPLEQRAMEIATAEFPGQALARTVVFGLWENTITLRDHTGLWMAEVCFDKRTRATYRVRRQLFGGSIVIPRA